MKEDSNNCLSFVGVGPQKTATTWLYQALGRHPDICFPKAVKEVFFWDRDHFRGIDWYLRHFGSIGQRLAGEIGPTYFHSEKAADRLFNHNPSMKIIITLRNPSARAFSLYLHHRMRGRVRDGFWEAVECIPEILEASHYSTHIPIWMDRFGRDQVLVLLQENIESQPDASIKRVCDFLNIQECIPHEKLQEKVNPASQPRNMVVAYWATRTGEWLRDRQLHWIINIAKSLGVKKACYSGGGQMVPEMSPSDYLRLQELFAPDVAFVEQLVGQDLSHWKETRTP